MLIMQRITKIEAAARQLSAAISLHFSRGDAISIHTLAAAALQILSDLAKKSTAQGILKDETFIRPEMQKEWRRLISDAENFFKHAERDPDGILEFHAESTAFFLLDATLLHAQLTKSLLPATNVFLIWFYVKHPNVLTDGVLGDLSARANRIKSDPDDYELFLELIDSMQTTKSGSI